MAEALAQNTVAVEELGPCLKKLTITIPGQAVDAQMESSLAMLMGQAQLPGFRQGRVPRRLVEKKFGSELRNEARSQLISSAYAGAVEEHGLEVLGDPEADGLADIEVEPGKDITLELEVEVAPEFEVPTYEGLAIRKPLIEVTDERIDAAIERMQINEGDLAPQEQASAGDYLIGRGVMREKGSSEDAEALLDIQGAVVQVPKEDDGGKGMILGVMVEDFADQLGKPSAGITATVSCVGPESHEREEVRGKDLTIDFTVDQVQRIVPASVDDLCERLGMLNEQMLRNALRGRLEQRVALDQQTAMRQQAAQHLLDAVDFELPEKVTTRQAERNVQRQSLEMQYRGLDANVIEERLAELRASSQDTAKRELKLFFLLARLAKALDVQVSEQDVLGQIAQMAASRGERPDKLRDQMVKSGQVNLVAQQIREHKVLDAVLEKAEVEELSVGAYNEAIKDASHVAEINESGDD